jgi:MoaA/NifB/PqqE/SkfB family radical SAM enzyme
MGGPTDLNLQNRMRSIAKEKFWTDFDTSKTSEDVRVDVPPKRAMVSLMGGCNLKCWHCPRSTIEAEGIQTSTEILDFIIECVLPHVTYLRIGGNDLGEPLLSRNLEYFLQRIDRNSVKEVHMVTNLSALNKRRAKILAETVDFLTVSVEGSGAQYERIRGFSWQKLLKNIQMVNEARANTPGSSLQISLSVCVLRSSFRHLAELFALKRMGVSTIVFREFIPNSPEEEGECLWTSPWRTAFSILHVMAMSVISRVPISVTYMDKYSPLSSLQDRLACYFPWDTISVDSFGNVSCCCNSLNLFQLDPLNDTAMSVANHDAMQEMRRKVNSPGPPDPCLECGFKTPYVHEEEKARLNRFRLQTRPLSALALLARAMFQAVTRWTQTHNAPSMN